MHGRHAWDAERIYNGAVEVVSQPKGSEDRLRFSPASIWVKHGGNGAGAVDDRGEDLHEEPEGATGKEDRREDADYERTRKFTWWQGLWRAMSIEGFTG